jgi:formylglycine-generating enzyme required for sulfatase activity
MKLTVGRGRYSEGFALPTILLVSTVMLIVLTASIAAAAASRVSLDSQYYNQLAQQAAQSGLNRANECLKSNGYAPQWSTSVANRDLRPDSDCTGATIGASYASPYIVGSGGSSPSNVRTKYSVEAPSGTTIGSTLKIVGTTELVRTSPPHNVWRSYEQSLYLRIEPPKTVACPEGFIAVPGDARFGTNDFCVGKYEAKNVGGKAVSQAEGLPYSNISQTKALEVAKDACAGCSLISNAQWLTVAHNVLNVNSNWSGGTVGSGYIYNGHNDNSPANALEASTDDSSGYHGTGNSTGDQRRTLRLNNGEVIWDLAGNVWEWTAETVTGGQPGQSGYAWREWNMVEGTGGISPSPFPSFGTPAASGWTSSQRIGRLYSSSTENGLRGAQRGSFFNGGATNAGIMALNFNDTPSTANAALGFRLVYDPLSTTRCPAGQVLIPGNSIFGTKNFCVGKYEAKNVGGVATSQAAGLPWTGITQPEAASVAADACGSCRLIREAEWLTIAHNIANVSSNWSSGTVGSGYIYSGHNDNSPSSVLAASTDDGSGYSGTGNSSGTQKRTLRINTGEIIWDFAGNAAEWVNENNITTANQPQPSSGWREWNTITDVGGLSPNPLPSYINSSAGSWTSANGIGRLLGVPTGAGMLRGGSRSNGISAGIFGLNINSPASGADMGFRVTSDPISAISCSNGMIPVPGDSRFGTTDFCVGKYEAKNVGGVATSQAAGEPWGSVSQTVAIATASAACNKCHLVSEAEWLTIAHNVMSVADNWSGGAVGVGNLYIGHTDNAPAEHLSAPAGDSDGYFGTGNTTGNQRRTLTLSNGEVIWDFSGNIYEWTSSQATGNPWGYTAATNTDWRSAPDPGNMSPNPYPAFGTPAASGWAWSRGIGTLYVNANSTNNYGYLRGGSKAWGTNSGIFSLVVAYHATSSSASFGFRVAQTP